MRRRRRVVGLLFCVALVLSASAPASAAVLDWSVVAWPPGSLSQAYLLSNGVTVTITFSTAATGTFGPHTGIPVTPTEDCTPTPGTCPMNFFGSLHDLGVVFDPVAAQGVSAVTITVSFSPAPVTLVQFEISDIDFSIGGGGQDYRLDQVVVTSDAGDPTLTFKTAAPRTFSIAGNTATANCSAPGPPGCDPTLDTTAAPSDTGTVVVDFGATPVTTVTITYNEASGQNNPAGRGIGLFGSFQETPVELMSFSVE